MITTYRLHRIIINLRNLNKCPNKTYHEESFQKNFTYKPEDRQSLCYNFILKRDKENKQYLIVSVTMKLKAYENSYYGNGAISMDINYDHFALAEINETGKLLDQKLIRFDLVKKSYEKMMENDDGKATDDAMVVETYGNVPVKLFEGGYDNIKVTTPEDVRLATNLVRVRKILHKLHILHDKLIYMQMKAYKKRFKEKKQKK